MPEPPRGTVAFLFTDIEGSTRLWQQHHAAMEQAYARHDVILRQAIAAHRGVVYKVIGDAFQVAFPSAPEAVAAALDAQFGLDLEPWPLPEPLRVRMVLHAGDVIPGPDGDYRSPVLNRLGRLVNAGHGGQVLVSQVVRQMAYEQLPEDAGFLDLGEHRLKDLLEPEPLYQLIHPGLASDFPPLKTLSVRHHNLPVQPTPFLGREDEVAQVVARLRDPAVRLLTLTGPGGTGKTRLALQAAAEVVEQFPDGVWFVPLAPLSDPALVPAALAAALGVREEGGRPLHDALGDVLREKRLLLVLDNVEHLLSAAPLVGTLLTVAPGLTVVATSRAPLRLRAEREHPVLPLGLPRRKPPPTLEQVGQYEAVRLFISRAEAVKPDFTVTNETAPAVAEICHRLDGLPLAIELAAARVKLLALPTMLTRLEQRLPLLTGGARDAPARQQTLRGAIAWSYDLLEPDERKLFRRLSVFAGGWTLEAAEAVAGTPESGELGLDVLDGLGRLVDQSLLRQEEGLSDECRYRLLETIREYGLSRLEAEGEAEEAHERHATFFLALAEGAEPALSGHEAGRELDRLETEHDNLRAALGWTATHAVGSALRLAAALGNFWFLRGHLTEGRGWLERLLAQDPPLPSHVRAAGLRWASALAWLQGNEEVGVTLGEAALELSRRVADRSGEAEALNNLALYAGARGDFDGAEALFGEALAGWRAVGNRSWIAWTANNLGSTVTQRGDPVRAEACFDEALSLFRALGDTHGIGAALSNLGEVALVRGDAARAAILFGEGLDRTADLKHVVYVTGSLRGMGAAMAMLGRADQAARLLGAAGGL